MDLEKDPFKHALSISIALCILIMFVVRAPDFFNDDGEDTVTAMFSPEPASVIDGSSFSDEGKKHVIAGVRVCKSGGSPCFKRSKSYLQQVLERGVKCVSLEKLPNETYSTACTTKDGLDIVDLLVKGGFATKTDRAITVNRRGE
ncbi:MAG: hypothetical protein AAGC81_08490 [Pseudomonadota bacterium]